MSGKHKGMRCYHCGMKIFSSIAAAKQHGWEVWVGGARCKSCDESNDLAVASHQSGDEPRTADRIECGHGRQTPTCLHRFCVATRDRIAELEAERERMKSAIEALRTALVDYVPYPYNLSDARNLGTDAVLLLARKAFDALAALDNKATK